MNLNVWNSSALFCQRLLYVWPAPLPVSVPCQNLRLKFEFGIWNIWSHVAPWFSTTTDQLTIGFQKWLRQTVDWKGILAADKASIVVKPRIVCFTVNLLQPTHETAPSREMRTFWRRMARALKMYSLCWCITLPTTPVDLGLWLRPLVRRAFWSGGPLLKPEAALKTFWNGTSSWRQALNSVWARAGSAPHSLVVVDARRVGRDGSSDIFYHWLNTSWYTPNHTSRPACVASSYGLFFLRVKNNV